MPLTDRGHFDALVVRTAYGNDPAWEQLKDLLLAPWGDGSVYFVDDPAWAGASTDEVLEAVAADEYSAVVFISDEATMQSEDHTLLAVTTATREEFGDEETAS